MAQDLATDWLDRSGTSAVADLAVREVRLDDLGMAHVRLDQTYRGVPVFGAQGIVHLAPNGEVRSFSDSVVRDLQLDPTPTLGEADAIAIGAALHGGDVDAIRADLQVLRHDGVDTLTWRVRIDDLRGAYPSRPVIFVDARTGQEVWSYDDLQTAKDRQTYSAKNKSSLPGTLFRSEGAAAVGDAPVDAAHDNAGTTYDYYDVEQGRDSYDDAGATIISSAHYSVSYDNAYWDGTQMVYGDGGVAFYPLSLSLDVVGHELTHAVTERSAGLIYAGESGGLNEGTSDIMGATIQSFSEGWLVDDTTWMVGEDITQPSYGLALRFMNDPPADGASVDNYADYTSFLDVHYSSGIANKAFYLIATDPAVGIESAADVWYRALTLYMTPSTTFLDARTDTVLAATDLYGAGSAQVAAVESAWDAVGVYSFEVFDTQAGLRGLAPSNTTFELVTPLGADVLKFALSGGTGNADLYVKFGATPSKTVYDCKDGGTGNAETCVIDAPQQGSYFVSIVGVKKYKNLTLTSSWAGTPPVEVCDDTVDNDGDTLIDCLDADCAADAFCAGP